MQDIVMATGPDKIENIYSNMSCKILLSLKDVTLIVKIFWLV